MLPAQSPQRSASFAPRRASDQVRRMIAPCDSSTSLPQLSHTRIVFLAMREMLPELGGCSRLPNSVRAKQADERELFRIEHDRAGADDAQMAGPEILDRSPV